ncbi:MAG: aspartate 1-decarboxylase [Acidaminococcaceae bacterium]|nr:aspartate 1-decarboxylase [Acidaminococcaceae bacterium]MDD4721594.1 aspartate 1-decarboxylase [Acidaminococcaceae bacterium]
MLYTIFHGKIHRATVTEANLEYMGSVTIDSDLMQQAGILEGERVQIVDNNNGNRLETYTIAGPAGSGIICLNGAAARKVTVGDKVIIIAYAQMTREEAEQLVPKIVMVDDNNKIIKNLGQEIHGTTYTEAKV